MANASDGLTPARVRHAGVWDDTRVLFVAAGVFFLFNIALGFLNAVTAGTIPHWQILTHLHAGALGWITLGAIGFAIWVVTGDRAVSEGYARTVRWLTWLTIVSFAAYVLSFPIAFSQGGSTWVLLPVFGFIAMLMVWAATGLVVSQLRQQPTISSAHVLLGSALLVASLGALMGVLIGLNHAVGVGIADVGAHAPVMFFYVVLLAAAIVDWAVLGAAERTWTRAGIAQAALLVAAAIALPLIVLAGLEMLGPVVLLLLLAFLVLFIYRVGWRAIRVNPLDGGARAWTFFGSIWIIVAILSFPLEIVLQPDIPDWLFPVLAHVGFVGVATNLLFAVLSVRTRDATDLVGWGEPAAVWLLNLGLVLFVVLRVVQGIRHGALVMGLGVLLGLIVVLYRFLAGESAATSG